MDNFWWTKLHEGKMVYYHLALLCLVGHWQRLLSNLVTAMFVEHVHQLSYFHVCSAELVLCVFSGVVSLGGHREEMTQVCGFTWRDTRYYLILIHCFGKCFLLWLATCHVLIKRKRPCLTQYYGRGTGNNSSFVESCSGQHVPPFI